MQKTATPQDVEAKIDGDLAQPGREIRSFGKVAQPGVGPDEGVLCDVFGFGRLAQQPQRRRVRGVLVAFEERLRRVEISVPRSSNEGNVVQAVTSPLPCTCRAKSRLFVSAPPVPDVTRERIDRSQRAYPERSRRKHAVPRRHADASKPLETAPRARARRVGGLTGLLAYRLCPFGAGFVAKRSSFSRTAARYASETATNGGTDSVHRHRQSRRRRSPPIRSPVEVRALTGLRGVAACYVLIYHYFPLEFGTAARNGFTNFLGHGYLAVDLFFVLSGFVMAMNYRHLFDRGWSTAGYLRFLGRRIARIYPLYLAATAAGFILVAAGSLRYPPTPQLGLALLANVLMVQAWGVASSFDSPAWSISAEWAAYLAFPLLLAPMFRRASVAAVAATVCAVVLALLSFQRASLAHDFNVHEPLNLSGPWLALPVVRCIAEFALGLLSFRVAGTDVSRRVLSNRWVAPLLCGVIVGIMAVPQSDLAVVLLFPVLVTSLANGTHLPARVLSSPPAELAGRLSFSIYLTHKLFYGVLLWVYTRGHAAGIAHAQFYAAAVCIALTAPTAWCAYRFIEVPGRSRLRRLFEGSSSDTVRSLSPRSSPNNA